MTKELEERLNKIKKEKEELEKKFLSPEIKKDVEKMKELTKKYHELSKILNLWSEYTTILKKISSTEECLSSEEPDLVSLAKEELASLTKQKEIIKKELNKILSPTHPDDSRNSIVEIRQGAGGDEASLFARDLLRMYTRFAEKEGWKVETINVHTTSVGGIKEITFLLKGKDVYKKMKYERGVHRVQRIPTTESSGRIHTSTVTVCVLPEASPVDVEIKDKDLKIETFRASGHGGQHVNKTSSAVRITHIPTGIVASCQDERSQHQNKAKAMKLLLARLYEKKSKERKEKEEKLRRSQIGEGDRAEKIRTYNYLQKRVTDHRINLTVYQLDSILDGELDIILTPLQNADKGVDKKG